MFSRDTLIWSVAVVVALFLGGLYERHQGAVGCVNADVAEANKHNALVGKQESAAAIAAAKLELQREKDLLQPIAPAPVIKLCIVTQSPKSGRVLSTRTPGPGENASPDSGAESTAVLTRSVDWDSKPVVQIGRSADADIRYLQGYIAEVCKPKK